MCYKYKKILNTINFHIILSIHCEWLQFLSSNIRVCTYFTNIYFALSGCYVVWLVTIFRELTTKYLKTHSNKLVLMMLCIWMYYGDCNYSQCMEIIIWKWSWPVFFVTIFLTNHVNKTNSHSCTNHDINSNTTSSIPCMTSFPGRWR
jgi:hypothetical protein